MARKTSPAADLEKVRRYLNILADLGRTAGGGRSPEQFLDQAVVHVARAVQIDHVKILRYRKKTADLLVVAGTGWRDGVVGSATLSADLTSAPGRSFQTAEPVVIGNFTAQKEFRVSPLLRGHGIVSLANAPIMMDGAAWGVLEVDSTQPCDFSRDMTDFLVAAGTIIGAALKRFEDQTEDSERALEAARLARQRETLLREIQHRVKNNFQLILASVALQKRRHPDVAAARALDHVMSRINAISLAHDQLSVREEGQVVDVADYLRALCNSIGHELEAIRIEPALDDLTLAIERAVSLGLIVNEAATNAIKHAFGPEGGTILVRLEAGLPFGQAQLGISDNGRGLGKAPPKGSGLGLIESLAAQIGGSVTRESSAAGTRIVVLFPVLG